MVVNNNFVAVGFRFMHNKVREEKKERSEMESVGSSINMHSCVGIVFVWSVATLLLSFVCDSFFLLSWFAFVSMFQLKTIHN